MIAENKGTSFEKNEIGRIRILVTGRVQGVGFRAFVQQVAEDLGLTGWVRNLGYDQVETVAEGDPEVLERFLRSVQAGPRSSRIDDVQVQWEPPLSETSHFEVRYR